MEDLVTELKTIRLEWESILAIAGAIANTLNSMPCHLETSDVGYPEWKALKTRFSELMPVQFTLETRMADIEARIADWKIAEEKGKSRGAYMKDSASYSRTILKEGAYHLQL